MPEVDTDTKVALLASLLGPSTFPYARYLEALTRSGGNVEKAAEGLLLLDVEDKGKDRGKRSNEGGSLDGWLGKRTRGEPDPSDRKAATPSPSKPKPSINLSALLRPPPSPISVKPKNPPQPALRLSTQSGLDSHNLPLTILDSPLSSAQASALYLTMMDESARWETNKWYLAGRWVESPHTTTVYKNPDGGYGDSENKSRYFYSGTELGTPADYPELLVQAVHQVEEAVNRFLEGHPRFKWEYSGKWRANICGANRYDGASSGVGWHADQLTYLGPYSTIASLSLGTKRAFRLRQTDSQEIGSKPIRTYEIDLSHNSLVLMRGGCQERFKHSIPPQKALDLFRPTFDVDGALIPLWKQQAFTSRINLTFRLLRADQKAKVRGQSRPAASLSAETNSAGVIHDDMLFFWQCQSPGQTGDLKGCGFFRILDMKAEGRGPCFGL
ncbi:hypothetical protein P7C73_g4482, partial [Tremellales sp. Uapishka_1]